MTRPELIKSDLHPYHVMSRCRDGDKFNLPLDIVWKEFKELLLIAHKEMDLKTHAFVLMGNHFHLLCQTPRKNIDEIMKKILSLSSRTLGETHQWSRYKWSLVSAPAYYYQVYRYVYQNPIRAGLVERVEDWSYSTLQEVPFPLHTHVPFSFGGEEGERLWLNERYTPEDQRLIRLGLRKFQFDVNQRSVKDFGRLTRPGELRDPGGSRK